MFSDDDTRILLDGLDLEDGDTLVDVHCWTGVETRCDASTRMVDYEELVRILDTAAR